MAEDPQEPELDDDLEDMDAGGDEDELPELPAEDGGEKAPKSFKLSLPFSSLDRFSLPFLSFPSFMRGLAGVVFILVLIGVWVGLRANDTLVMQQEKLASKTAVIDRNPVRIVIEGQELPPGMQPHLMAQQKERPEGALTPAPQEGLYEVLNGALLPRARMADGMTPFEAYKRPFNWVLGKPLIAIVVTDMGISKEGSDAAIKVFPPDVTFVFSTYAENLNYWADASRDAGHEIWLSLPMQNFEYPYNDPGPQTLLTNASLEQNQSRLFSTLSSMSGYAGIVTGENHIFTASDLTDSPVMRQILGRGLGIADSNTKGQIISPDSIKQNHYPYVQNNFWIDDDLSPGAIQDKLKMAELYAAKNGMVVAFIRPYPVSYMITLQWMKGLENKGFQLAPLSALSEPPKL